MSPFTGTPPPLGGKLDGQSFATSRLQPVHFAHVQERRFRLSQKPVRTPPPGCPVATTTAAVWIWGDELRAAGPDGKTANIIGDVPKRCRLPAILQPCADHPPSALCSVTLESQTEVSMKPVIESEGTVGAELTRDATEDKGSPPSPPAQCSDYLFRK
ncbi:hypothetical protein D4764_20G0001740 [Takifugu flavidus]|uniref:Uncharacterized protein n=1 Tax=Takifugu flavidus TaxID=433684 RepID=A0A5C6NF31_9TELE|nr:hypothetical protein D4764_20G0001740 [Takifugu flavidus]